MWFLYLVGAVTNGIGLQAMEAILPAGEGPQAFVWYAIHGIVAYLLTETLMDSASTGEAPAYITGPYKGAVGAARKPIWELGFVNMFFIGLVNGMVYGALRSNMEIGGGNVLESAIMYVLVGGGSLLASLATSKVVYGVDKYL